MTFLNNRKITFIFLQSNRLFSPQMSLNFLLKRCQCQMPHLTDATRHWWYSNQTCEATFLIWWHVEQQYVDWLNSQCDKDNLRATPSEEKQIKSTAPKGGANQSYQNVQPEDRQQIKLSQRTREPDDHCDLAYVSQSPKISTIR